MTQERYEEMQDSISRQTAAGFSMAEIKLNLLGSGYSREEIDRFKFLLTEAAPERKGRGREYFSLVVSVLLILRGFMLIGNGVPGWGTVLLLIGVVGLIVKISLMVRDR